MLPSQFEYYYKFKLSYFEIDLFNSWTNLKQKTAFKTLNEIGSTEMQIKEEH